MSFGETQSTIENHSAEGQHGRARFTDHIDGNGEGLFKELEALKLEGMIIAKGGSRERLQMMKRWTVFRQSVRVESESERRRSVPSLREKRRAPSGG